MNRRELLAFLSLGGASTASGCNGVLDGMLGGLPIAQPTSRRLNESPIKQPELPSETKRRLLGT